MSALRGDFHYPEGEIRSFDRLDAEQALQVLAMRNDQRVSRWMTSGGRISEEAHLSFMARQKDDDRNFSYLVSDEQGSLGVIALHRLDTRNQLAFVGLYRNPFEVRVGLGSRLLAVLCRHAFEVAQLHTLKLEVAADNYRAIRLYERHQFVHEGRWREVVRRGDSFEDLIAMGLHAREWNDA